MSRIKSLPWTELIAGLALVVAGFSAYVAWGVAKREQKLNRPSLDVDDDYAVAENCFNRGVLTVLVTNIGRQPVTIRRIRFWDDELVESPADEEDGREYMVLDQVVRRRGEFRRGASDHGLPKRLEAGQLAEFRYSFKMLAGVEGEALESVAVYLSSGLPFEEDILEASDLRELTPGQRLDRCGPNDKPEPLNP